jgi:DNA-binding beta-propeller fold protein YncE
VKPRLAVTADFLAKRLSIVDIDKLKEAGKRADALVGEVDLSMYAPGPLAVGVTPDGKTAVVSISSGWLSDIDSSIPSGSGGLVFVDLEKRTVIGQLDTGERPMGIIISPDSKRAFVGHYSENYFAVVDIEKRTFERVQTGGSFNEELALDDTGTIGVLTYGPQGNAVSFPIATPTMVGRTSGLSGDAGGVAFFPGTKLAFVIQAPTVLTGNVGGYNVLDVSNPLMPMSTHNVRVNASPVQYPVTTNVARKSIVFPSSQDEMLSLVEMKLEGMMAKEVKKVSLGPAPSIAYGLTSTPDGKVLAAQAGAHFLAVVDMEAGTSFNVAWEQAELGPVDVRMIP